MSLYKLNLHAHTRYSDGGSSIKEMAQAYKDAGFCCCVITDHYYGRLAYYSLTKESYLVAREEAKKVSEELNYPVIIGIECGYNRMEEINVFGHDAIMYLFNNGIAHWNFEEARSKYNCAMILNHPQATVSIDAGVYKVIDGFERCNSGQDYFEGEVGVEDRRVIPPEFAGINQYSNSDAHDIELDEGFNLIDREIKTEEELVDFIKNGSGPRQLCADGKFLIL